MNKVTQSFSTTPSVKQFSGGETLPLCATRAPESSVVIQRIKGVYRNISFAESIRTRPCQGVREIATTFCGVLVSMQSTLFTVSRRGTSSFGQRLGAGRENSATVTNLLSEKTAREEASAHGLKWSLLLCKALWAVSSGDLDRLLTVWRLCAHSAQGYFRTEQTKICCPLHAAISLRLLGL